MRTSTQAKTLTFGAALLIASSTAMAFSTGARAQRRACVEETSPPPTAGEQAECWFGRHSYRNAAAWCADADLSDEAAGNLCFSAYVRAGRFEDAARVAGTLERVRPAGRACHAAFTTGLRVRIVPNPASGAVHVDGEAYGRGVSEVLLAPPFWDHRVEVRFGGRSVRVSERRLRRTLDAESCAARDVVVDGPEAGSTSGGGPPVGGIVLIGAGGAAAVAGTIMMLIAESNAQEIADLRPGVDPPPRWEDYEGTVDPLRYGGAVAIGIGVAAAVVGLAVSIGLFDGSASSDVERNEARRRGGSF